MASVALIGTAGCGPAPPAASTPENGSVASAHTTSGESWGALRGTLVWVGEVPRLDPIPTAGKDPGTCNPDGIRDETLIVNAENRGIRNVVIYARKVERVHESAAELAAEKVVLSIRHCVFEDRAIGIQVGQVLEITNRDPISHNANVSPPADQAIIGLLAPLPITRQFSRAQNVPFPVTCNIHPWMRSYILPRKDPYFAVTDQNGAFEIPNLPAGEDVEFQVWHERVGPLATDDWRRGRFTRAIHSGTNDLGTIQLDSSLFDI